MKKQALSYWAVNIVAGTALMTVLFALIWIFSAPRPGPHCEITFTQPRSVIDSNLPVRALWGIEGIKTSTMLSGTNLVATGQAVIATDRFCNRVVAFDWSNGGMVWNTPVGQIQPWNIALDVARNRVYVSGIRSVWALSTTDGQVLWSNGSERFVRNEHFVYVRGDGQVMIDDLFIDPATGHLSPSPIQLDSDISDQPSLIDMDSLRLFPVVQNNEASSNFTSADHILYFMDVTARLHFLDLNSGEEKGAIQFTKPEKTPLLGQPGGIGGSSLAVEGSRIAIYFQDTNQLSAYEIERG